MTRLMPRSGMTASASSNIPHKSLRFILLGDSGVGKTSLMQRFVNDTFSENSVATISPDLKVDEMEVDGKWYTLYLVDTAGSERFRSVCRNFYRGAHCCVLTFALNDHYSFDNMSHWQEEFLHFFHEGRGMDRHSYLPFVVVGNKADNSKQRVISEDRAREWCMAHGDIPYFEASAKSGLNVQEVFVAAVRRVQEFDSFKSPTFALPEKQRKMNDSVVDLTTRTLDFSSSLKRSKCC